MHIAVTTVVMSLIKRTLINTITSILQTMCRTLIADIDITENL